MRNNRMEDQNENERSVKKKKKLKTVLTEPTEKSDH